MKERPILFSAPMVRALLDGSKTQTRRIAKPQFDPIAEPEEISATTPEGFLTTGHSGLWWDAGQCDIDKAIQCPYGQPGDRLWVREAWRTVGGLMDDKPPRDIRPDAPLRFEADGNFSNLSFHPGKLRPSMFMPRWASRITLEIVSVRVERLQDISEADAWAEGVHDWMGKETPWKGRLAPVAVHAYAALWESINGRGSWNANPWCWAVEFRRIEK